MDRLRPTSFPRGLVPVAGLARLVASSEHRKLLQIPQRAKEEPYFVDYIPPARDAIAVPPNVAYILVGVVLVVVATYAIVGHLIKDLMHDLADCILGPKTADDEDLDAEGVDVEEEHCVSSANRQAEVEADEDQMEAEQEEREGLLLPGSRLRHEDGETGANPELRGAAAPSSGEEWGSVVPRGVAFSGPALPYATSL